MNTFVVPVNDWLTYIGVNDRLTPLFENQWPIDHGVSYNSYLIKDEKTVLMDGVKAMKADEFLRKLQAGLDGRPLDYFVIQHMEPDHSGTIPLIHALYPEAVLVGNKKTFEFLENFYSPEEDNPLKGAEKLVVKSGDVLETGSHRLRFVQTPMVHWPESMVSYEETTGTLFSQDIFGCYGSLDGAIFDDEICWADYAYDTARYYSNIVGKYAKMAQRSLNSLGGLGIQMICPLHGPIWRENPQKIIRLYSHLADYDTEEGCLIAYGSMYGNTQQMAEYLARRLAERGIKHIRIYDVSKTSASYIQTEALLHRGLILGSCTYNNALFPPMENLCQVIAENKFENHILGLFGSYSWSGGAVKALKSFADSQKFEQLERVVEVKSSPTDENWQQLTVLADEMADALIRDREKNVENLLDL